MNEMNEMNEFKGVKPNHLMHGGDVTYLEMQGGRREEGFFPMQMRN